MYYIARLVSSRTAALTANQIRTVIRYSSRKSLSVSQGPSNSNVVCISQFSSRASNMGEVDPKADIRKRLTPMQYHVTQEKGTEKPFSGKYDKTTDPGNYSCIVCGQVLFASETKYDSGCGWPAFNDVLNKGLVKLSKDTSNGLVRTEVQCSKCDAHLGHVFDDGPLPTGKRYCINSASLDFHPK